jgi:hypothetical protein
MMYPPDLRACAGAVDLCVHLPHPCLGSSDGQHATEKAHSATGRCTIRECISARTGASEANRLAFRRAFVDDWDLAK